MCADTFKINNFLKKFERKHIFLILSSGLILQRRIPTGNQSHIPLLVVGVDLIYSKRGHENVKKWTSKVDIFSKKYIIVPVNEAYPPKKTDPRRKWKGTR